MVEGHAVGKSSKATLLEKVVFIFLSAVACSPPDIDLDVYQVRHYQSSEPVLKFPMGTPSGTKFDVDLKEVGCGDAMTTIQCLRGQWNLPRPHCYAGNVRVSYCLNDCF